MKQCYDYRNHRRIHIRVNKLMEYRKYIIKDFFSGQLLFSPSLYI